MFSELLRAIDQADRDLGDSRSGVSKTKA